MQADVRYAKAYGLFLARSFLITLEIESVIRIENIDDCTKGRLTKLVEEIRDAEMRAKAIVDGDDYRTPDGQTADRSTCDANADTA